MRVQPLQCQRANVRVRVSGKVAVMTCRHKAKYPDKKLVSAWPRPDAHSSPLWYFVSIICGIWNGLGCSKEAMIGPN